MSFRALLSLPATPSPSDYRACPFPWQSLRNCPGPRPANGGGALTLGDAIARWLPVVHTLTLFLGYSHVSDAGFEALFAAIGAQAALLSELALDVRNRGTVCVVDNTVTRQTGSALTDRVVDTFVAWHSARTAPLASLTLHLTGNALSVQNTACPACLCPVTNHGALLLREHTDIIPRTETIGVRNVFWHRVHIDLRQNACDVFQVISRR